MSDRPATPDPARPGPGTARRWARALEATLFVLALLFGYVARAQIGAGWTFTGSDGYIYMGTAMELSEHGRYAVRLPPWSPAQVAVPPLSHGRPPGYALFLSALTLAPKPAALSYDAFFARAKPVQRLLDLLTCALVFWFGLRIGGRLCAWPAYLLAICHPVLWMYAASIMTETLATLLSSAVLFLLARALGRDTPAPRAEFHLVLAGALCGAAMLVRADGILLTPCLGLPLLLRRDPKVLRLRALGLALVALLLVFAPWPARNHLRFSALHPFGHTCDTRGSPIEHIWFMRWFATWITREEQMPSTLWCVLRPECQATHATYPEEAFDSPQERRELGRLLALQKRAATSAQADAGFRDLTLARLRRHPFRILLYLPLQRARHMWINRNDLPLRSTLTLPWPAVMSRLQRGLLWISVPIGLAGAVGLLCLLTLRRWRAHRAVGVLAAAALLGRTAFFSLTTFIDGRYLLEVVPLLLVLSGVAFAQGVYGLRYVLCPRSSLPRSRPRVR